MIRYVSFHNGNISSELIAMQKAVMDTFNIPIEQIQSDLLHGTAIDKFLEEEPWDLLVLFDIDCIPLRWNEGYIGNIGLEPFNRKLFGAPQRANHIPDSKDYASPAFMVLRKELYETIGKPSFEPTHRGDCAEEISYGCRDKGILIEYLDVMHVDQPYWSLEDGTPFGYGTTFGNLFIEVNHAFESRANHFSTDNFYMKIKNTHIILETFTVNDQLG